MWCHMGGGDKLTPTSKVICLIISTLHLAKLPCLHRITKKDCVTFLIACVSPICVIAATLIKFPKAILYLVVIIEEKKLRICIYKCLSENMYECLSGFDFILFSENKLNEFFYYIFQLYTYP